jgi:hypothetical protein
MSICISTDNFESKYNQTLRQRDNLPQESTALNIRLTDFWMDLLSTTRSGKTLGYIDNTIFTIDCTIVAYIVMPLALSAVETTTCQKMITLAFGRSTQETYSSSF